MINNGYSVLEGRLEWGKKNSRFFNCNYYEGRVTIEIWVHDLLAGDLSFLTFFNFDKKEMNDLLVVLIETLCIPGSEIRGHRPIFSQKTNINRNYEFLEKQIKVKTLSSMYAPFAYLGIGVSVINWIFIIFGEIINLYLPVIGIFLGIGVLIGRSKIQNSGEKASTLQFVLAIISIIISVGSLILFFSQL